jgi:hypothetical protein
MKILLGAAATAMALTVLAGCSGDNDDGDTATDPASTPTSSDSAEEPTVGTYPELAAEDYTYVLEQICFCPITGPVKVVVEDGEVTSAVVLEGGGGIKKGSDAPDYLWLTINDVIAQANDTEAADVQVTWPDGQNWPDQVQVDKVENATDDEINYLVSGVEVQ